MIKPVVGRPPFAVEIGIEFVKSDPSGCFGPWLMALVGTTFMLGVTTVQSTKYFSTFGFESLRLFALVVSCIILSVAQWVILILGTWDWFVVGYGDWRRYAMVPWHFPAMEIITRLTVFIPQIFFAHRCYVLYNRSKFVFAGVMSGMLASLVLFMVLSTVLAIDPYYIPFLTNLMTAALCVNLVTDVTITILTLWKLGLRDGETFSPRTDDVLRRLRNVTIEATVPPAVCAIINIALCLKPRAFAYQWFGYMTPRLYVWSLMFTLNSRVAIRQKLNSPANQDSEAAETLSTGFEFAKVPRSNEKPGYADPERATVLVSNLSRPAHIAGNSTAITAEQATTDREMSGRRELLRHEITTTRASAFRQKVDLDRHEGQNPEPESAWGVVPRRPRRNSEPPARLYV